MHAHDAREADEHDLAQPARHLAAVLPAEVHAHDEHRHRRRQRQQENSGAEKLTCNNKNAKRLAVHNRDTGAGVG